MNIIRKILEVIGWISIIALGFVVIQIIVAVIDTLVISYIINYFMEVYSIWP